MNFIHSITFRFTLWYLAILTVLLTLLGSGVYVALSRVSHRNLDDALITRAQQLSRFRDIIGIVAGGTFEEQIGEHVAFYYYADNKQMYISHRDTRIPIKPEQIDRAIGGHSSISSINTPSNGRLRVYAMPFTPGNPPTHPSPPPKPGDSRHRMDANRDGMVSKTEMMAHEKKKFAQIDTDGSGAITGYEMDADDQRKKPAHAPRPDDRFDKMDRDGDRVVSLTEYLADEARKFERLDTDKDDQLSPDEIRRDRRPHAPPNDPSDGPPDGRKPASRPPQPLTMGIASAALVVARSTTDIEESLGRLLHILLMAIPLTIVLSGGGGVFLARRAFKPIEAMTETAREISESDLSRRIPLTTRDELGKLASTLNQMIERLESAFQRRIQFTGDASHELRAPLAVIKAEASLALQKKRSPEVYRKSLEIISQESDHVSGIINQLLTLARADAGKERLTFEIIHLSRFIKEFCSDTEILCREKGLRLQMDLAAHISVQGNRSSLRRLLHNLISNAIRYTAGGGTISIGLRRENLWAVVSVTDSGIGIPARDIPHLFERFYRVDKARSRNEGGSGLGLAICKHVVDAHKGRVYVESQIGKGSSFYVKLPLIQSQSTSRIPGTQP